MAQRDVVILNEVPVPSQLQEIQAGDTYRLPADVAITGDLAVTGTVDGRDVAADGALAAAALRPDGTKPLTSDWNVGAFKITVQSLGVGQFIDFTPIAAPAHVEGRVFYDSTEKALSHYTEEADVTMNIGQEVWIRVFNNSGVLIENGSVCAISGATGANAEVTKALATATSPRVLGIATHDIEDQTYGYITTFGMVRDVDTSAYTAGDTLYLSRTVAGEFVGTKSSIPNETAEVGVVVLVHASTGSILVDIEHNPSVLPIGRSYNFSSRTAASGEYFLGGFYEYDAADANLTDASATKVYGTANSSYAAHAFMVFGAGSTNGTTITLTVTGTSVTDAGVRTPADSEVLFTGDPATLSLNNYLETVLKWIGQVTYTLTSDGGTFALDFNYGLAKYEDFQSIDYTLRALEVVGLCDVSDAGFNVQLLHHESTAWTYSAAAFVAGSSHDPASLVTIHSTESNLIAGENFAFKMTGIDHWIEGSGAEGILIRITTTTNNAIAYLNAQIDATVP